MLFPWLRRRATDAAACAPSAPATEASCRVVTIAEGYELDAGSVLGKETASGCYSPFDPYATDGTEEPTEILRRSVNTLSGPADAEVHADGATLHRDSVEWFCASREHVASATTKLRATRGFEFN